MKDIILHEKADPGLEVFLEEFITDREEDLLLFKSALENKNFSKIKSIAHKLKGFCAPYGYKFLEQKCLELEELASHKDLSQIEKTLTIIEEYLILKKEKFFNEKL